MSVVKGFRAVPEGASLQQKRKLVADFCRWMGEQMMDPPVGPKAAAPGPEAAQDPRIAGLAPRVRQTLQRLLVGDSEKQIALNLGVSPHTVHVYIKRLYRTFEVSSRGELLAKFVDVRSLGDAGQVPHPGDLPG